MKKIYVILEIFQKYDTDSDVITLSAHNTLEDAKKELIALESVEMDKIREYSKNFSGGDDEMEIPIERWRHGEKFLVYDPIETTNSLVVEIHETILK